MASDGVELVGIEYTARAMRQDAELAMGSDLVRAIIELVTNSDDAYQNRSIRNGSILIRIQRRRNQPSILEVHDRAGGMSRDEIRARLARAGGATSGFAQGKAVRGLLGRGAKDVAHFGPTTWDTVHAGRRNRFTIDLSKTTEPAGRIEAEQRVLGNEEGTTASIEIDKRFSVQKHNNLKRALERHYALRPILLDRRNRTLKLQDGSKRAVKLTYHPPQGDVIADRQRISIPGYPQHFAIVSLQKAPHALDDDGQGPAYWQHSLLIRSDRAAYEMFAAGRYLREPYAQYLRRLFGTVEVPSINLLIREYERRSAESSSHPEENPISLVSRDRDGLVRRADHPFVDALYTAIEDFLEPHVEQIREESERRNNPRFDAESRKSHDEAGRVVSKYFRDADEELQGNVLPGGLPPLGLSIVPPKKVVEPGRKTSLTIRYRSIDPTVAIVAEVKIKNLSGAMHVYSEDKVVLQQVSGGYFSGTARVPARSEGSQSLLAVRVEDADADAVIEWRMVPDEPVTKMEFEQSRYPLQEGQRRVLKLVAPFELFDQVDEIPDMMIQGDSSISLSGQPGVFTTDSGGQHLVCPIPVKGAGLGSKAKVTATVGSHVAETRIEVVSGGASGVHPSVEERDSQYRAWLEPDKGKLVLNASHPALKSALGPKDEGWPGLSHAHYQTMAAELMAVTAARRVLQGKYLNQRLSADQLFQELESEVGKLALPLHRALVTDAEARGASST